MRELCLPFLYANYDRLGAFYIWLEDPDSLPSAMDLRSCEEAYEIVVRSRGFEVLGVTEAGYSSSGGLRRLVFNFEPHFSARYYRWKKRVDFYAFEPLLKLSFGEERPKPGEAVEICREEIGEGAKFVRWESSGRVREIWAVRPLESEEFEELFTPAELLVVILA